MLLKSAKTCIKTNGYVSKYFSISRSARQGCPIAPFLYILQAEPLACAIRAEKEIQGIILPGEENGELIETKLNMFADDTQLFNKNESSVRKSFEILDKYEKASGSKINYEKTKGINIGANKRKRPTFKKISWTTDNIKTLGIHHGYNIDNDKIWKSILEKVQNCVHVWKSRKLTYSGKALIVKNLILSVCGYELEIRGIPEKYKKELNKIIWNFIWDGKVNQVDRKVCCLDVKKGAWGWLIWIVE